MKHYIKNMKKAYSYLAILFLAALSMTALNATKLQGNKELDKHKNFAVRFNKDTNQKSIYKNDIALEYSFFPNNVLANQRKNMRGILSELGKALVKKQTKHFIFELPYIENLVKANDSNFNNNNNNIVDVNNDSKDNLTNEQENQAKAYLTFINNCIDSYKIQPHNIYIECTRAIFDEKNKTITKTILTDYLTKLGLQNTFKSLLLDSQSDAQFVLLGSEINEASEAITWEKAPINHLKDDKYKEIFGNKFNKTAFYDTYGRAISLVFKGAVVVAILAVYRLLIINKNVGGITDSVKSISWLPNILKRIMLVTWRL